jgi:2-succinyl-5-enolpyruvyl-6-hydroxy-3-cyclohexene-1-carboxylate synthase
VPLSTAREVLRTAPSGSLVLTGSSLPVRDIDRVGQGRRDVEVHANRGASGIDGTVSSALGLALGSGRPVTALLGDITLLHDSNGFLLSPDAPTPQVTFVVVDNGGGRIFDLLPPSRHAPAFERLFTTPHGRDLADLARLHGIDVKSIDERDASPEALLRLAAELAPPGLELLHVRVDATAEQELRARLRMAVTDALRPR